MANLNWGAAIGGLFLAAGVAFAGLTLGQSLIEMRRVDRVVTVKGLAEQAVEADFANWRIPFRAQGDDSASAIAEAKRSEKAVRGFLSAAGLPEAEVLEEPFTLRIERIYVTRNGAQTEVPRYVAVGAVRVRSSNLDLVEDLVNGTQALLDDGVLLGDNDYAEASRPVYVYSGLNEIKPELIREATQAARASAQQFANDSGASVGGIAKANQGIIQILPRDGDYDERFERRKLVRVVSTVSYYLTD
ncbi:MAG: SIMPL domain-containing protein [Neomegalonema sp.]|nr:SIMPL domain-containing protein [Neomegalonema sp.]